MWDIYIFIYINKIYQDIYIKIYTFIQKFKHSYIQLSREMKIWEVRSQKHTWHTASLTLFLTSLSVAYVGTFLLVCIGWERKMLQDQCFLFLVLFIPWAITSQTLRISSESSVWDLIGLSGRRRDIFRATGRKQWTRKR